MMKKMILLLVLVATSFSASDDEHPPDPCSLSEFSCSKGGCISVSLVCDGMRDCADGGDELGCDNRFLNSSSTDPALDQPGRQVFGCRKNEWTCWDGSCIASRFQCDGVIDCEDGSDENIAACRASIYMRSLAVVAKLAGTYQQNSLLEGAKFIEKLLGVGIDTTHSSHRQQYTCELPKYPSFGTYNTINITNAKPGNIYDSVTIDVICQNGYGVDGPSSMVQCKNGVWLAPMPNCVSQCYLPPNPSVKYRCVVSGEVLGSRDCTENEPVGTVVDPQCQSNYYSPTPIMYMRCNNHGTWDNVVKCIQECGTVTADGTGLIHGGRKAKKAEVPWHAGIYTKAKKPYEQICGGSLISNNIVISAAHCFWDDKVGELPATDYAVAVGKLYRPWIDSNDEAQQSNVKKLHLPEHFQGSKTHFQSDIAVIVTTIRFKFNLFIRPVCVDFDYGFDTIQLQPEKTGKVAGWGLTETGKESPVLRVIELPYVSIEQCRRDLPESFHPYISNDKICAGFNRTGQAVCKGDSGGGLAFPAPERDKKRYYLRGIVSTAPTNDYDTCNAFAYTCFTQLRKHEHFIKQFWTADDLSSTDTPLIGFDDDVLISLQGSLCTLPPYPDHGMYTTNIPNAEPGGAFNSVEVNITCQQGYGVNGSSFVYCLEGQWSEEVPKCVSQCYLKPHPSVEYRCLVSGLFGSFRPCKEYEITGSVASPQCRRPNFYSPTTLPLMRCIDGHWDYVARCHPECGTVTSDSTDLISGEKPAVTRMEVPWHAGIYKKAANQYTLICGGSLISNNIVLSAAHCFWSESDGPLPASNYAVAVGSSNDTQRSDVKEIHLTTHYAGRAGNFQDDIAVVIVQTSFVYSVFIRPVCVDFDYVFEKRQLQPGTNGKMAVWSKGEDGNSSQVLQVVNLPYVSVRKCIAESSDRFRPYITADKICAGFANGSESVCKGSSGSGLAFPETDAGQQRFYIRGILSGANSESSNDDCTANIHTFRFTQTLNHEHFIKKFWLDDLDDAGSNRSQKAICKLPDYPAHGTYVSYTPEAKPGDSFDYVIINVTCNQGYGVVGSNTVYCFHGIWMQKLPTCVSLCHLKPDPSVEYRCLVSGPIEGSRACNEYEPSGTVASPQCRQPFYKSETPLPFMHCIDGNWDYTVKTCFPECGTVSPAGTALVVGGRSAKRAEAPWHADIYSKITDPYKQICSGSLVSESVVISAAHCFWSSTTERPEPPTNFAVAVGKLFYLWEDTENNAQRSDVMEVHLPAQFQGNSANYQADLAVVVVVKPFNLMKFIRPVCIDFQVSYERQHLQQGNIGRVAGWGLKAANKNSAQVLNVVDVPYVDIETCITEAPEELLQFITSDKICSNLTESALCATDSGSGLAFPELDGGTERYYLRGVLASVTKFENRCSEKDDTAIYTRILAQESFIKSVAPIPTRPPYKPRYYGSAGGGSGGGISRHVLAALLG